MKKMLFLLVLTSLLLSTQSNAKAFRMSDDAAKSKAISLWGPHGAVAKFWVAGSANTWAYQVGCYDSINGFHITGQGLASWETAYANVDTTKNGTFVITATATQSDGQKSISPQVNIYACDAVFDKSKAQFIVAN